MAGIASIQFGGIKIQQEIGIVTKVIWTEAPISPLGFDGILGMGTGCGKQSSSFFMTKLMSALPNPIFSANLRRGEVGHVTLGTVGRHKPPSALKTVPVERPEAGSWDVNFRGVTIGNDRTFVDSMDNAPSSFGKSSFVQVFEAN